MSVEPNTVTDTDTLINKIIELRILTSQDITNDYWFIQYLASILDYFERSNNGFLSALGWSSVKLDISPLFKRINESMQIENARVPQKDLVKFMLYMLNSYVISTLFLGMTQIAFEVDSHFLEIHNDLPVYIINDLPTLGDRANNLVQHFKQILDKYSILLEPKYNSIFNVERHRAFNKQIFDNYKMNSKFSPAEIAAARECK